MLFVVDQAPINRESTLELVDPILSWVLMDLPCTVVLIGAGVRHGLSRSGEPDCSAAFGQIHAMGVEQILVDRESLGPDEADLPLRKGFQTIDRAQTRQLLHQERTPLLHLVFFTGNHPHFDLMLDCLDKGDRVIMATGIDTESEKRLSAAAQKRGANAWQMTSDTGLLPAIDAAMLARHLEQSGATQTWR